MAPTRPVPLEEVSITNEFDLLKLAVDVSMEGLSILAGDTYRYMNRAHGMVLGYEPEELIGKTWRMLYDDAERTRIEREFFPILGEHGRWSGEVRGLHRAGHLVDLEISLTRLPANALMPDGGLICTCRDIVARKQNEQMLRRTLEDQIRTNEEREGAIQALEATQRELMEKIATIERQRSALRDMSVPILELWDDVLTLPIVGIIDSQRAADMTDRLLGRIGERRTRGVIIDLTGVEVVDTMTAAHIVKLSQAASLLGSFCVLTGIGPQVAQTLTVMGVDLGGLTTARSLRDGLRICLARIGRA
ncbi:STAS domain-containing protein [Polyangium sorediatum]|uniref:STAS domain-containing protein n=1 Tax=Polyangium sorediatum TaxID=889274 RepID=A0ABT6P5E4_9BACT|nr:STAS domain-containing protein [Polyangium sorediatum]MDI1435851.1 STAS domain-containing protein [Polyangium sorediatum]